VRACLLEAPCPRSTSAQSLKNAFNWWSNVDAAMPSRASNLSPVLSPGARCAVLKGCHLLSL
jgi:hypothetical protein